MTAEWARDLFRQIAVPRLPGSKAVCDVEVLVTERLRSFGYDVRHQPFETSPDRLWATTVAGVGLGWCSLLLFPLLVLPVAGLWAPVIGAATLVLVAVAATQVARGRGRIGRSIVAATNIVATRGPSPRLWLVAHSDSKAQRLSLRGRVLAFAALGVGVAALVTCLVLRILTPLSAGWVAPWIGLTLAGAAGISGPPLVGKSPGAVDNASGMIAALAAAELLRERSDIGVLVTGAEEFGMEGARAWTATESAHGLFVNFDGIDHAGSFNIMVHAPHRGAGSDTGFPTVRRLLGGVRERALVLGHPIRQSRLPLGIFVDGSVLASAGMGGITISRGNWSTLGVVHTPKDTVERTSHESAVAVGEMVAHAAEGLLG